MRIPKQVSLTKSLALTISLVLLVSGIVYVLAAAPSSTFWLAPGVYPGAPSFTVWREGDNYFAKNANGEIAFSGTNATEVIQDSIDNMEVGQTIFFRQGTYDGVFITVNKAIHMIGELASWMGNTGGRGTVFVDGAYAGSAKNQPMINVTVSSVYDEGTCGLIIENIAFIHRLADPSPAIYIKNMRKPTLRNLYIDGVGQGGIGIECTSTAGTTALGFATIQQVSIRRVADRAFYIYNTSGANQFLNCHFETVSGAKAALEIENMGGNAIIGGEYVCADGAGILLDRSGYNHIEKIWFEWSKVGINMTDETGTSAEQTKNNVVVNCNFGLGDEGYYNVVFDWASRNTVSYPYPWSNGTNTDYAALFTDHSRYNRVEGFKVTWNVNHEISGGSIGNSIIELHAFSDTGRDDIIPYEGTYFWSLTDHNWNIYNSTHWILPDGTVT